MSDQPALDIVYPSGFYSFQTPVMLDYVAAINGVAPPVAAGAPFTYLDLGCGDAFTITLLAAIYPGCRFLGVDLNPAHIAAGNALAAACGIANLQLIEGSFEEWRRLDLPECHYIGLHGVYAWISEAARQSVLDLAAARLAEGGLLYLGYNANPGWASVAPLRQFFLDYTRGMAGDPVANVAATLRHLQELRARGAAYFTQNPAASRILDEMAGRDIRYVAHEIYSPHWSPLPFSTVARQMRDAGLAFVGSADLARNYARPSVRAELLPYLLKEKNRERAELHRDYAANTFFRRDVFVNGAGPSAERQEALLAAIPWGSKAPVGELGRAIPLPDGEMSLADEPYESLRRALAAGTHRIAELQRFPGLKSASAEELGRALQALALGFQIAPFARAAAPEAAPASWTVPLAVNRRLLRDPVGGNENYLLLIAPTLGNALPVAPADALVLLAVAEAGVGDAAAWAWDYAAPRKAWLRLKGAPASDPAKHRAAFAEARAAMTPRLAKFVELGIIAPR